MLLLAPHLEPRYLQVYAVLQDDLSQPLPTERLVRSVLGSAPAGADAVDAVAPAARLVRAGVMHRPGGAYAPGAQPLRLADDVVAVLRGDERPPVAGADATRWMRGPARSPRTTASWSCTVRGTGPRRPGRWSARAPRPWRSTCRPSRRSAELARTAWRIGVATGAVPILDLGQLPDGVAYAVTRALERLVDDLGGTAWLLTRHPLPRPVPHLEAGPPSWTERRAAWAAEAAAAGVDLDVEGRHRAGHSLPLRPAGDPPGHRPTQVTTATSTPRRPDPGSGVRPAQPAGRCRSAPRRPRAARHDPRGPGTAGLLRAEPRRCRGGPRVARRCPRSDGERGPVVLFAGPSGTGKTLAAEAVARRRSGARSTSVDLSQLVSKYIGETEKHIDEVLAAGRAGRRRSLFFDEADAMFAARTEQVSNASDRFANLGVGFLLQRIERHDGVVILATNLRHAIDEAFLRRFHFRVEFPLPRRWSSAADLGARAAGPDRRAPTISTCAGWPSATGFAGGEIRNAALRGHLPRRGARGRRSARRSSSRRWRSSCWSWAGYSHGRRDARQPQRGRGQQRGPGRAAPPLHSTALETLVDDRLRERFTQGDPRRARAAHATRRWPAAPGRVAGLLPHGPRRAGRAAAGLRGLGVVPLHRGGARAARRRARGALRRPLPPAARAARPRCGCRRATTSTCCTGSGAATVIRCGRRWSSTSRSRRRAAGQRSVSVTRVRWPSSRAR